MMLALVHGLWTWGSVLNLSQVLYKIGPYNIFFHNHVFAYIPKTTVDQYVVMSMCHELTGVRFIFLIAATVIGRTNSVLSHMPTTPSCSEFYTRSIMKLWRRTTVLPKP